MRHKVFTLACVISLLLCAATAMLWVRSYRVADSWSFSSQIVPPLPLSPPRVWRAQRLLISSQGRFQFYERRLAQMPAARPDPVGYQENGTFKVPFGRALGVPGFGVPGEWHWSVPGFTFDNRPVWSRKIRTFGQISAKGEIVENPAGAERTLLGIGERSVIVAFWLPSALTSILPALWIVSRWFRRGRKCRDQCPACGYDLTGNVSGVCPECGTPIAPIPPARP